MHGQKNIKLYNDIVGFTDCMYIQIYTHTLYALYYCPNTTGMTHLKSKNSSLLGRHFIDKKNSLFVTATCSGFMSNTLLYTVVTNLQHNAINTLLKLRSQTRNNKQNDDSWQLSNLAHKFFSMYLFIYSSLHVSSMSRSSSGETDCINTASGNCHSVLVAVSCAGWE